MQLKLDADRGRQTRRRRSGPGRRCRASGGAAPTRTPGRGGLVLGQPQPQPRDGLDVPEFPRRWLPAARGGNPAIRRPRLVGVAHTPKRPTRRRSMKPLFVEAGRVRGRGGAPPGQAGPEGVSAGAQQARLLLRHPADPGHPGSRHGHTAPHPHDRRATYDHVNRADEQPGANHHGAHAREHLPGPEWRLRQRPREQRGDRYHPAPAPSAKRVTTPATVALTQHSLLTLRVASCPRWRSASLGRASAPLA
jgi:hypothetical protein